MNIKQSLPQTPTYIIHTRTYRQTRDFNDDISDNARQKITRCEKAIKSILLE